MSQLSKPLSANDFDNDDIIRADDRKGFRGRPRVVKIRGPFKLYKLTGDKAPQHRTRGFVTPWWSAVDAPCLEDEEGARGRFRQAYMNGIDMSSMVRYMSAVKVEWNSLTEYVEISVKSGMELECFWGEFAPMPLTDITDEEGNPISPEKIKENILKINNYSKTASGAQGYSDAVLPTHLGALLAWQFYIPKLTDQFIENGAARICIDAHNMKDLARHLGLELHNVKDLQEISKLFIEFEKDVQIQNALAAPELRAMRDCLPELWRLNVDPKEVLGRFWGLGKSYTARSGVATNPIKVKVENYLARAEPLGFKMAKL